MTTPYEVRKKCYLRDFKKVPNQNSIDIPKLTSKALFVANSKVSTNAHLVQICLKVGAKGMFCSSKLQVKQKHDAHVCNHSSVARKDSSIIWSAKWICTEVQNSAGIDNSSEFHLSHKLVSARKMGISIVIAQWKSSQSSTNFSRAGFSYLDGSSRISSIDKNHQNTLQQAFDQHVFLHWI